MAHANPWYGYRRVAVMCRQADQPVKNREAYRVMAAHDLLHKRLLRKAELYQASCTSCFHSARMNYGRWM